MSAMHSANRSNVKLVHSRTDFPAPVRFPIHRIIMLHRHLLISTANLASPSNPLPRYTEMAVVHDGRARGGRRTLLEAWPESGGGCASGYTWGQQV